MVGVERKDIVKLFLEAGVLLRPGELAWLAEQDERVVKKIAEAPAAKEELARRMAPDTPGFEIIKNLTAKPGKVTAELQGRFLNSRYEQMKALVSQRVARGWVSINRLPFRGETFLTGIVRNIREGEKTVIELEDPTGAIPIVFEGRPDVRLDEFAAVRAAAAGKAIFGKEIIYPDIPIRPATLGVGRGCFVSDLHLEEAPLSDARRLFAAVSAEAADWLFVAGDTGDSGLFEELVGNAQTFLIPGEADTADAYPQLGLKTSKANIVSLSNPSVVRVGGLAILLCHNFVTEMLRRRHLGPSDEILESDFLILDHIPDIVACGHDHKPLVSNYKATTVVNAGSLLTQPLPVVVDFKTREWKQIRI